MKSQPNISNKSAQVLAIVIPFYNASNQILKVVEAIPTTIDYVIIVDDCSTEALPTEAIRALLKSEIKLEILKTISNTGVGGATKIGFQKSLDLNATITIKVDADNQMDLSYLPNLINPLVKNKADFAKGNRFRDLKALRNMPFVRRIGNLILSFLIKVATGYWNVFDPTNGYFAIKNSLLKDIELSKLSNRYYFETSLLAELYFLKTRILDVAMPSIYGDEKSNMILWKMPFLFSRNLVVTFIKRILKEYFLYNFNIASLFISIGLPLFLFGVIFGIKSWIFYATQNTFAPTGTIMIITLSIILGFQLLLQAVQFDISNTPKCKR
jgi:dolichol-phosphate mannosyltransferase